MNMQENTDNQKMLQALAQFVSLNHKDQPTVEELINSTQLLDEAVKTLKIQWKVIANSIDVDRNKLYHWYHETHLRHSANVKISSIQKEFMQRLIIQGIQSREIEQQDFAKNLKNIVFADNQIHRSEFSMTFNNIIRCKGIATLIRKNGIVLPNRRNLPAEEIVQHVGNATLELLQTMINE